MFQIITTPPTAGLQAPRMAESIDLSLSDAVRMALRQNPDLIAAAAQVTAAREEISVARANLNPAFVVSATATGLDRTQKAGFAFPGFPPVSFTTATRDQSQFLIGADLPLDFSGQIRHAIHYASAGRDAIEQQRQALRNQVAVRVRQAFYDILQARELVNVAEEAVHNAEERERTAESYVRAGTATRFETLRAATATADARQNLLVARNRVTLARAALANVLGIAQTTEFRLIPPETTSLPNLPGFDEAVAEAERQRSELLAAAAQVKAAEIAVRIAAASDAPTVGVGTQYQHSPRPGFGQAKDLSAISLKLTAPLYDRGISNAKARETRARVDATRSAYQSTRNNIMLEVRQEWLARQEADDRLKVSSAALSQAEEQYRLAQNRYRAGINLRGDFSSPLLEISDAQTALTQAQTNAVNARFDVLKAQARLEGALGRFSRSEEVKP